MFIHLENFSLFNNPSMASSRETIKMLCECFPERLGKDTTVLYSTLLYTTLHYSALLCSTLLYSTLLYSTLLYCSRYFYPCHMSYLSCRITSTTVATRDTLSHHIFHINHTTQHNTYRSLSVLSPSMGVQNRLRSHEKIRGSKNHKQSHILIRR